MIMISILKSEYIIPFRTSSSTEVKLIDGVRRYACLGGSIRTIFRLFKRIVTSLKVDFTCEVCALNIMFTRLQWEYIVHVNMPR
jgi:hypothetical protein